jgi:biopolymer transport protein ExbD
MTPMIDVVFQLIIFFLVSSHLAKQEVQLTLPLPVADSGHQPEESPAKRLTINVLDDGVLTLAGRTVAIEELADQLRAVRAGQPEEMEVRVRSDRRVPYRRIEPVLLACARARIWNVTFGVYRSEDVH